MSVAEGKKGNAKKPKMHLKVTFKYTIKLKYSVEYC